MTDGPVRQSRLRACVYGHLRSHTCDATHDTFSEKMFCFRGLLRSRVCFWSPLAGRPRGCAGVLCVRAVPRMSRPAWCCWLRCRAFVRARIRARWSPAVIAGRPAAAQGGSPVRATWHVSRFRAGRRGVRHDQGVRRADVQASVLTGASGRKAPGLERFLPRSVSSHHALMPHPPSQG